MIFQQNCDCPNLNKGTTQGPKGMPDQEISVQNKDKQPKNLKK